MGDGGRVVQVVLHQVIGRVGGSGGHSTGWRLEGGGKVHRKCSQYKATYNN